MVAAEQIDRSARSSKHSQRYSPVHRCSVCTVLITMDAVLSATWVDEACGQCSQSRTRATTHHVEGRPSQVIVEAFFTVALSL